MENNWDNEMRRQVWKTPALLRELYPDLEPKARYALTTPEIYGIKRIILTGCGDCFAAAQSVRLSMEQLTGCGVEVVSPLELSRHYPVSTVGAGPGEILVVAISLSGKTPRVLEAAMGMQRCGALILAVTKDPQSPLGALGKVLPVSVPALPSAPGTALYGALLMAGYLLAIRIGEVRLRYPMDTANQYRGELLRLLEEMEKRLDQWDGTVPSLCAGSREIVLGEVIGSGCDRGTAYYGSAKLYEAAGIPCTTPDSEEWFHIHCFSKQWANTLTVVLYNRDNTAHSRTRELTERLKQMGRRFVAIGDPCEGATEEFAMPQTAYPFLIPFLQWVPLALIASYLAAIAGESYHRGFQGIWAEGEGIPSSWCSEIITEGEA